MTEVYDPKVIRPLFKQLVKDFGGWDASAAVLGVNKGSISKMIAGDLPIHTHHWAALEDAAERWPITDLLHDRRGRDGAASNLERLAERVLREHGDIPNAVVRLLVHGDASAIVKEGPELLSELQALIEAARAAEGGE